MLQPRKLKHRKHFRGTMKGIRTKGTTLAFGEYGLKSLGRGWLTDRQIEAGRRAITHSTKRAGKIWIRVFPDKPVTAKPSGAKMGSGKGDVTGYIVVIRPGKIIFEIAGVEVELAREAMRLAAAKLPFKTKFIIRESR
ncbi:MAG TPA: 50S ribosomal protein L16 [Candidatus Bathyarchaeia archaeon]|nr:50S ribosomal protein L16 [Candidatus Bathyarchaeia archaeon]